MAMIKKVGVIGSGQMGNGIAHVAALAGFEVVLNDVSADRLKSAMATINGNLSRQVAKKIITEDARKQALNRIVSSGTMDGLADCDLVIETAVEKEEVKRKIFHDLCAVLKPDALIASNTSSISITRLAATTDRPERFIGIHFMNGTGRTDPRHRHRRFDLRCGQGICHQARQAHRGFRGFSRVHRQPHPAADDQ
jgi:3-hydroxybutyryl-CoA dehydrogenase